MHMTASEARKVHLDRESRRDSEKRSFDVDVMQAGATAT